MQASPLLCGIFIGGASRRLGGHPKGLLPDPATGQPLVVRLADLAAQNGLRCVLVGQRPEYAALNLPMLADRPAGVGPLGGLLALLEAAPEGAIALSCDLPYLGAALLERLVTATMHDCDILAPRRGEDAPWEPLFARYQPSVLPTLRQALAAQEYSFQRLFKSGRLRIAQLELSAEERLELDDWDAAADLPADVLPLLDHEP